MVWAWLGPARDAELRNTLLGPTRQQRGMMSIFSAISEDHTDDEWFDLLRLVLDNFPESGPVMFLVVETEDVNLIKAIQKFTDTANLTAAGKCKVKVLLIVSSSVVEIPSLPPTSLQINVSSVYHAPPVPAKLKF